MKKNLLKTALTLGLVLSFSSPAIGKEVKPLISDCGGAEHPLPCWAY
ncbi:hypothetical protein SAMN04487786_0004 [Paenisporosarcina quisquiliarum]|jgi:hypothetical protein|nr:hypothetical protein SAMN04487786_0004 [Paenisporosarcina quisquiliarum]